MAVFSTAGSTLSIGPAAPATSVDTAAEFDALSYTEVLEVEDLGELGDQNTIIPFISIKDKRVRKQKGSADAGDMAVVVGRDPLDAGQIAMDTAQGSKLEYAFKMVLTDALDANDTPSKFYFRALVSSKRINLGNADTIGRKTYILAITSQIYETPAAVVP